MSLILVTLAAFTLVLASPLLLPALDDAGNHDWEHLSNIGQTYGAISALLSVMAVGGVVASLVLQTQAAKLDRLQAHRAVHLELLKMAINDPDLLACWRTSAGTSEPKTPGKQRSDVELRQDVYCNQVVSWWEMSFDVGAINEVWLRGAARDCSPAM